MGAAMIHVSHSYTKLVQHNVYSNRQTTMSLRFEEALAKKLESLGFSPTKTKDEVIYKMAKRWEKAVAKAEAQLLTPSENTP